MLSQAFTTFKKEKTFIVLLFLGALLVRGVSQVMYLSKNPVLLAYDAEVYHEVGQQLADGKGFTNKDGSDHFYRVPIYPAFLGMSFWLFDGDVQKTMWLQIVLGSLIPLLVFLLSLILFPGSVAIARLSGILTAIHLGLVIFSTFVMSETLFMIFLLCFSIVYFTQFNLFFCGKAMPIDWWKLGLAGALLGLASLTRPVGQYVIIVAMFMFFFERGSWIHAIKKSLIIFASWAVIVSPWLVRNHMLTGHVFFHTLPGTHFMTNFAARLPMRAGHGTYDEGLKKISNEAQRRIKAGEKEKGRSLSEIEISNVKESLSWEYTKQYPFEALVLSISNMIRTTISLYVAEILNIESLGELPTYEYRTYGEMIMRFLNPPGSSLLLRLIIYMEILFLLILLLGTLGTLVSAVFSQSLSCVLGKVIPLMALFVIITLACGFARLRMPIDPFLMILSSHFWLAWLYKKRLV